jgi:hypothetical protein
MNNIKVMTIFIVLQIFVNKNDYVFSRKGKNTQNLVKNQGDFSLRY